MKILTILFMSNMVASKRLVAVFLSGSLIRFRAIADDLLFSSLRATRSLGFRLKKAFSELENSPEKNKNITTTSIPIIPYSRVVLNE